MSSLEPDLGVRVARQWAIGATDVAAAVIGLGCVLVYHVTAPADGNPAGSETSARAE